MPSEETFELVARSVHRFLHFRALAVESGALDNPEIVAIVSHDGQGHALTDTVLRTLLADRDRLAGEVAELQAEREAWREGVVTRLEQRLGQRVVLTLEPKDLCPEDFNGFRCQRKPHGEEVLHRAPYASGYVQWTSAYGRAVTSAKEDGHG